MAFLEVVQNTGLENWLFVGQIKSILNLLYYELDTHLRLTNLSPCILSSGGIKLSHSSFL